MNTSTYSAILAASLLVFLASWYFFVPVPTPPSYVLAKAPKPDVTEEPFYDENWVSQGQTNETHSANVALLQDVPVSVWYGGSREGHADVALWFSHYKDEAWSKPVAIMNRATAEEGLNRYIRKVGNPAIHVWPDGRITVYFVTVSIGGWGGSAIAATHSDDGGQSWSSPKRIVTSPFLNISTLVRTSALPINDNRIQLPVYHEFIGKFSESLTLDESDRVIDKRRMTRGNHSLQPATVSFSEQEAVSLIRYAGTGVGRVLISSTDSAGVYWTKPEKLDIPNPNSAIATINVGNGQLLAALNDLEDGRIRLSLAVANTDSPMDWRVFHTVDEEPGADPASHEFEFSYPGFVVDSKGVIHLLYTWNQVRIKHVKFNQAWLADQAG